MILTAAFEEFSQNGLAGARVDLVARRAGVNKRMLYHYFTDKLGLFREVIRRRMTDRTRWLSAAPEDPAEMAHYWYSLMWNDLDWIRLLEWEALEIAEGNIIAEEKRQEVFQNALKCLCGWSGYLREEEAKQKGENLNEGQTKFPSRTNLDCPDAGYDRLAHRMPSETGGSHQR